MNQNNAIEVSVVLPCLNEEASIGICVSQVKEVFAREGISGEIIVADNGSIDKSPEIAVSCGAKVFLEEYKGYGAAYLRGIKEARGKYIIIGDSDNTYDFNDIPKFLELLRNGCDLVMGSRFKGKMQKGAMSWSHRYIGNPILSGLFRVFFRTNLTDIHCGMRGFTKEAFVKMKLVTLGMEFASEMVFAALNNNFKICEVPINYYPRKGESKLSPLFDAWRHTRFMLLYCPVWLYFVPATFGFIPGFSMLLLLFRGPFLFLGHYWDVHLMIFASVLCILSYQIFHLGVYAHTVAIREGFIKADRQTRFFQRHFSLEKGLLLGGVIFLTGAAVMGFIFMEWYFKHFGALSRIRESIFAMTFLVIGIQTMFSSFFISFLFLERK